MSTTHKYSRRTPEKNLLYRTLQEHLNAFISELAMEGRALPKHVEKELCAYLDCGILVNGFIRVNCSDCNTEHLVAFSCKKRGFCPSSPNSKLRKLIIPGKTRLKLKKKKKV